VHKSNCRAASLPRLNNQRLPTHWLIYAQALPPPNPTEGGYFFSLMSIVFGTLTASTISDATARLAALRAAAVEECTLMLPLIKRLEVILVLDSDAPERGDDVFRAVARRLHLCGNQPVS
jgi:hypothetical protein